VLAAADELRSDAEPLEGAAGGGGLRQEAGQLESAGAGSAMRSAAQSSAYSALPALTAVPTTSLPRARKAASRSEIQPRLPAGISSDSAWRTMPFTPGSASSVSSAWSSRWSELTCPGTCRSRPHGQRRWKGWRYGGSPFRTKRT
jgi:hypothetical protein